MCYLVLLVQEYSLIICLGFNILSPLTCFACIENIPLFNVLKINRRPS